MSRTDRLTAIILLLQERPRTSGEIARVFEVSKRTVIRDIQSLCEMGVPVIAQDGVNGGYSLPSDYSLAPLRLSLHEVFLLRLALSAVDKVSEVPFPQARASLLAKLHAIIPESHKRQVADIDSVLAFDVPARDQKAPFVEPLLQYAREGQWVQAVYHSARGLSNPILLPKRLTCQSGFWYCAAYSHEHGEERTYRVDRFESLHPIDPPTEAPAEDSRLPYDHPSHPEVVVELSRSAVFQVERDQHLGRYLERRPDGSALWRFRCPPSELDWLARYLIPLGQEATVIDPPELKSCMIRAAEKILFGYRER